MVTTTIATSIPVTHHLPDTATQAQIAAATAVGLARNYAFTAAGVALFVYLVGSIACFWLPEPKALDLSE